MLHVLEFWEWMGHAYMCVGASHSEGVRRCRRERALSVYKTSGSLASSACSCSCERPLPRPPNVGSSAPVLGEIIVSHLSESF
jgi:hypothetical protein